MLRQFEKEGRRTISAVDQQGEQFLDQLAEDGVKGETLFQLEFRRQQFAIAIETVRPSVKPLYWEAFRLSYIENLGIKETAERLETDVKTVYVARHRVLNRIRSEVNQLSQWQDYLDPE